MGVAYVAMVGVNFLANGLPINDRSTGAISDAYPNLFAPAGVTFSIWGLIYLLLAGYVAFQFGKGNQKTEEIFDRINPLFLATSLANISWIFAWHYDYIGLSVVIMAVLLALLVRIADILRAGAVHSRGTTADPDSLQRVLRLDHCRGDRQRDGISGEHRLERIRYGGCFLDKYHSLGRSIDRNPSDAQG